MRFLTKKVFRLVMHGLICTLEIYLTTLFRTMHKNGGQFGFVQTEILTSEWPSFMAL